MTIKENINLAQYTTFRLGGPARFFCLIDREDEIVEAMAFAQSKKLPILIIGGGSNLLISDTGFNGLVMKMEIKGIETVKSLDSDDGFEYIEVGAGEEFDSFIAEMVNRGFYGLENLSAIPGTAGATPVQNIGAYGVEVGNYIHSVRVMDTRTMKFIELLNEDCHFSYRQSRFKEEKGRYIVTKVIFKLSKTGKTDIGYKDLNDYFSVHTDLKPSVQNVRKAIIEIRAGKLPDWKMWGTAGSFFKNPILSAEKFKELRLKYPDMPGYPELDGRVKAPLGWILDKLCDARGLTIGNVGTFDKQALVVVAKPGATASEVVVFSTELMRRVKEKTGIEIESEVEWAIA